MLNGKVEMFVADPNICSNFVTESPNILLAGYKCVSGDLFFKKKDGVYCISIRISVFLIASCFNL